jgi:DNA-binding NarL/FixJ family response regulator
MMKSIHVLLADDHTLVRSGLRRTLEQIAEVKVVAEASTGREVLQLLKTVHPEVVLMNITMRDLGGLEATAYIKRDYPQVRVIILALHANEQCVRHAVHAGAAGYLVTDAAETELEFAVKAVMRGETYLSPAIAHYVLSEYRRHLHGTAKEESRMTPVLIPRERELLQLIAEGYASKEIAARMNLSPKAVEARRARLMEQLDIHNLAGLVRYAIRLGLVSPES